MKLLKVPPYKQTRSTCGPTSLRMVLAYYGIEKTNAELEKMTNCSLKYGTEAKNILNAAKKLGLTGVIKDNSTLSDLRKWYKANVPVIVDWFDEDDGHYCPLIKIDAKNIWLLDPQTAKPRKIPLTKFKLIWFDFRGTEVNAKTKFVINRIIVIHP